MRISTLHFRHLPAVSIPLLLATPLPGFQHHLEQIVKMDMSNMHSGHSTGMSMSMVFTTDHSTPLYSSQWTPTSSGGYAGTCIFLVVLAIISRLLQAYRHLLEVKWHDRAVQRRYVVIAGESPAQREKQLGADETETSEEATLTVRGADERVRVLRTSRRGVETQPWRISTDLPRACVFTVQAGVGYLLSV